MHVNVERGSERRYFLSVVVFLLMFTFPQMLRIFSIDASLLVRHIFQEGKPRSVCLKVFGASFLVPSLLAFGYFCRHFFRLPSLVLCISGLVPVVRMSVLLLQVQASAD